MVSTPLLLTNLKLLSVVNSDSQKAVTAALLHATHHRSPSVYVHMFIQLPFVGTYVYSSIAIHHQSLQCIVFQPSSENADEPQFSVDPLQNLPCFGFVRYIGALGARVICDNIPGLVNKQRQLCQRHPDIMQAIGEGTKEWIRECQHQFRHHRWNCSTLDRDHTVFGRVLLRSKSTCALTCTACLSDNWLCGQGVWIPNTICYYLAPYAHPSSILSLPYLSFFPLALFFLRSFLLTLTYALVYSD